jgi:L-2-hydroxyglutarate oxidase LhgO
VVSGLAAGTHRYFLSSPKDAFGPDHGEVAMPQDQGIFLVNFAQHFNAVLYGKPEPAAPTEGIPGVTARMEP